MVETTHDDAIVIIKRHLNNGSMTWGDLLAALGWTKGRLQHHVSLMETSGEIYSTRIVRDDRLIKLLSLRPFDEGEDRGTLEVVMINEDDDVARLKSGIISKLLEFTVLDLKDYFGKFVDLDGNKYLTDEVMTGKMIGTAILDIILIQMGFNGVKDPKVTEILKGGN